jgi:hypothetical protein
MIKSNGHVLNPLATTEAPSLCFHAVKGAVGSALESKDLGLFAFLVPTAK